jgi:general secretion pathway protein G
MKSRENAGFTLVELLLVLFIVALLASLVAPVMTSSVQNARESALKEDLHVMRKAIDDFYADTGRYPESLDQLVEKRYIRKVPIDPMTERVNSWVEIRGEGQNAGVIDVVSGSDGKSSDGVAYRDW